MKFSIYIKTAAVVGFVGVLGVLFQNAAPISANSPIVIYSNYNDSAEIQAQYAKWGIQKSKLIYDHEFLPSGIKSGNQWDESKLTTWLNQNVALNDSSYLAIDWETIAPAWRAPGIPVEAQKSINDILLNTADPQYTTVVNQMLALMSRIRALRPNLKLGYWGIPITNYWQMYCELIRDYNPSYNGTECSTIVKGDFKKDQAKVQQIINASDVIFPNMYQNYKPTKVGLAFDSQIYAEMLRVSLQVAGSRAVLIYTWDRYFDFGDEAYRFERVPSDEYGNFIKNLSLVEYGGKQISGVVIWGSDAFFYSAAFQKNSSNQYIYNDPQGQWSQKRNVISAECPNLNQSQFCVENFIVNTYQNTSDALFTGPPIITYKESNLDWLQGSTINTVTPMVRGPLSNCIISPTLPAGLVFNAANCSISGTPTEDRLASTYTVVASNSTGTNQYNLKISVLDQQQVLTLLTTVLLVE